MKKMIYSSLLGLTLCAQPVFSALAKPWKQVKKGVTSAAEAIKGQITPTIPQTVKGANIQTLMDRISTLRSELTTIAKERGTLRNQLFAAAPTSDSSLKDQIAQLGRKMGGLSGQRTKVRNNLATLFGTKHGDLGNLKDKLAKLDATLTQLGSEKRTLESEFDTILSRSATSDQVGKLDDLNSKINLLGNQIRGLEAQLDGLLMVG